MTDTPKLLLGAYDVQLAGVPSHVINVESPPFSGDIASALTEVDARGGGVVLLAAKAYSYASTLVVPHTVSLIGAGRGTVLTYTGSGSAIKLSGNTQSIISDFLLVTTNKAANGIEVGNASRKCIIANVELDGTNTADTTGAGFLLDAGTGWSGGLTIRDSYTVGYKYGVKMVGTHLDNNTWTSVDMTNLWLVGRAAGVIAGSAGIYMDAFTNGVGTYLRGGTIEAFATGIEVLTGGSGGSFECDMEGNTADYSVGSTFNGYIRPTSSDRSFEQWTNGAVNKWGQVKKAIGVQTVETRYTQNHVIYEGSGSVQEWNFYRGDSLIDGGAPTRKFRISCGTAASSSPEKDFIEVDGHKIAYHTGIPTAGTWAANDIVFLTKHDRGTAQDGIMGYVCVTGGTPGTWIPFCYQSYDGSAAWNPGSIAAGAVATTTITIGGYGITTGNFVQVAPPYDVTDLIVTAFVKSATVIQINVYNPTGAPIVLGNGTWKVRVNL